MSEFIKYGWDVLYLAFKGAWAITECAAAIIAILGGVIVWKYPRWESTMKNLLWMIPVGFFVLLLILRVAIVAPYDIYKSQQQKINESQNTLKETQEKVSKSQNDLAVAQDRINELKDKLAIAQKQTPNTDTINVKPVTKQEIRAFLESINTEILQRIDGRQKEMHVLMSDSKRAKLIELSERPDFNKFLDIKKSGAHCIGGAPESGFIKEFGENGAMVGCYLYPKDALIK